MWHGDVFLVPVSSLQLQPTDRRGGTKPDPVICQMLVSILNCCVPNSQLLCCVDDIYGDGESFYLQVVPRQFALY
jgi:hypothetical protein